MRRLLPILFFCFLALPAHAWNGAGHRLSAVIAWQQLSPRTRLEIGKILTVHPDYDRWREKAASLRDLDIFAEAATWPDDIRHDPRFYDELKDAPTPAIPGLPDTARHATWHYVDIDAKGKIEAGELDSRIEQLEQVLRSTKNQDELAWALPWLLHLVADIHQPMHVGKHDDAGGNAIEIENPGNRQRPFSSLHSYWDELPGPSGLRGKQLARLASELIERYPAPMQGSIRRWRNESHQLLASAYPPDNGSLLPTISEEFAQYSRQIAQQQIVAAGNRLGRLLEQIFAHRVSRETQ